MGRLAMGNGEALQSVAKHVLFSEATTTLNYKWIKPVSSNKAVGRILYKCTLCPAKEHLGGGHASCSHSYLHAFFVRTYLLSASSSPS